MDKENLIDQVILNLALLGFTTIVLEVFVMTGIISVQTAFGW